MGETGVAYNLRLTRASAIKVDGLDMWERISRQHSTGSEGRHMIGRFVGIDGDGLGSPQHITTPHTKTPRYKQTPLSFRPNPAMRVNAARSHLGHSIRPDSVSDYCVIRETREHINLPSRALK